MSKNIIYNDMAKKKSSLENIGNENGGSVFDLIKSFDNSAEILADSKMAVIKDYIGTGNYILNACMTGSIFKGVPTGRVLTLSGDPGCLQKNEKIEIYIIKGRDEHHDKINL